MTAAPAVEPAPVHQPEPPYVVRVRMRTHAWTSPGMSKVDAETLQVTITEQVEAVGDTWRFVTFAGRDGKLYEIRGREVAAVEVAPEGPPEPRQHRGQVAGIQVHVDGVVPDPPADGTSFLRQHAAAAARHGRGQR